MSEKMFILLTLTVLFNIGIFQVEAFEKSLSACCYHGEKWAEQGNFCSDYKGPVDNVPIEFQPVCLSTLEICCSRRHRWEQCNLGQEAAKTGEDCLQTRTSFGTEFFKDCCEACKIGLIVGSTMDKCSLGNFEFGSPWDESYEQCCTGWKTTGEPFILPEGADMNLCGTFENLCSQICENTEGSYICKCNAGYVLMSDNISCEKEMETLTTQATISESTKKDYDDEADLESESECESGYFKNKENICEDIDECETGDATCDLKTEVCFNKPGTYNCLAVIPSSTICDKGLRFNVKTEQCEDINECMEELDDCSKLTHFCLNLRGSFMCKEKKFLNCLPGMLFDPDQRSCADINECLDETTCHPEKTCVNTPGSFECQAKTSKKIPFLLSKEKKQPCAPGFRRLYDKCVDIDECSTNRNSCDSNQICINEPGSFRCNCKIGFVLDGFTNACVDVNECQINAHECLATQRCDNTIGSYNCIRLQGCGTGYTLNAASGQCEDDDECILKTHNCIAPYECRNTIGSFRCHKVRPTTTQRPTTTTTQKTFRQQYQPPSHTRYNTDAQNEEYNRSYGPCDVGFERNDQGACSDINECLQSSACRRNQRCTNTNGSYRCENLIKCSGGYTSNDAGTDCIDIDECETNEAHCGPDQMCRNKPGGYVCYCPPGHILGADKRCEDINECEFYNNKVCPTNAECINTVGSYRCECKSGFKKNHEDEKTCSDIDECKEIQGLCGQKCINYYGHYRCACESGYKLAENNRTCDDIDECEVHKSYHLCMGICDNTPGSYSCRCPPGYNLGTDGRTCQDVDECSTQHICRERNEICTNTRGSYRCTRVHCPPDYVIDNERKNRCKRKSLMCDYDDTECFKKPSSYSYNFITLVSNMSIPPSGRGLFNLKGPNWYDNIDFDFRVIHVNAPQDIEQANEHYFSMHKMSNEVLLSLVRTMEGPQDIELELSMTVYRNGQPVGTSVAKIFIIVSEYAY